MTPSRVGLWTALLISAASCGSKATEGMNPGECSDGLDNDENGLLDCADPGCSGSPDCEPADTGGDTAEDTGDDTGDTGETDTGGADPAWPATITWLQVPAGEFAMGATEAEEEHPDDEFARTITLTYDYEIAAVEVTQALYTEATGLVPDSSCGETCPVVGLTWHEAARVTALLSTAAGLDPCYSCTGEGDAAYCVPLGQPMWCAGYRLPLEAEWERAARADAGTIYAGAETPETVAWTSANSGGAAQPVAGLSANAWGAYDFSGNAWEWCHELWMEMPDAEITEDPTGPTTGEFRVIRGGAFDADAADARAANREPLGPGEKLSSTGLRLARTLNP